MAEQDWIVVHGRFQPFHRGHLDGLVTALRRSRPVVVGITNPHPARLVREDASAHRHLPDANPFTYFERAEMVLRSAAEAAATAAARDPVVRVVPFDVSDPPSWAAVLPPFCRHLVTVNEPWDEEKARRFRAHGFAVEEVAGNPGRVTGTEVRLRMAARGDWRVLVPAGTARVIDEYRLADRLPAAEKTGK